MKTATKRSQVAKAATPPAAKRSALDAAAEVLADGQERTCQELIGAMAHRGLWSSHGATPQATLNAALHRDMAKHGAASRFRKAAPGRFALATTTVTTAAKDLSPLALTDAQRVLLGYDEIQDRMTLWKVFDGKTSPTEGELETLIFDVRHLPGRGEADPSVAAAATRLRKKVAAYLQAVNRPADAEAVLR